MRASVWSRTITSLYFCLLVPQWHRTPTTQETDGFQVKRPGDVSVRCTLLLMLDYQVRAPRHLSDSSVGNVCHEIGCCGDNLQDARAHSRAFQTRPVKFDKDVVGLMYKVLWCCLRSLPSLSWTLAWPACLAFTLRLAPASSRPSGSMWRPISCRTPMTRSTSTVTSTSNRCETLHVPQKCGFSRNSPTHSKHDWPESERIREADGWFKPAFLLLVSGDTIADVPGALVLFVSKTLEKYPHKIQYICWDGHVLSALR